MRKAHGTVDTLVDAYGKVYTTNGIPKKTYRNNDGYITTLVRREDGSQQTVGVHTLVANTFLQASKTIERNQVNHRDMCKTLNQVGNLEWVSQEENNLHEDIMTNTEVKPKVLVYKPDGSSTVYRSIDEACNFLFGTRLKLWDAVRSGEFGVLKVKYLRAADSIPAEHRLPTTSGILGNNGTDAFKTSVSVLDLDTNVQTTHASMNDCAAIHGVSASHIYQCIATQHRLRLFQKRYLIWRIESGKPNWSLDELKGARNRGPREVLVYSLKSNVLTHHETATAFIKEAKLSKKRVTTDLSAGRLRWTEGYVYTYNDDTAEARLRSFIESPVS